MPGGCDVEAHGRGGTDRAAVVVDAGRITDKAVVDAIINSQPHTNGKRTTAQVERALKLNCDPGRMRGNGTGHV